MKPITVLAMAVGLSGIAHAQAPQGPGPLEALMLASSGERVPLSDERLDVAIDGQEASTTLVQTYRNASNARIEGNYHLKPGSGSHVDGFAYWNGEQKIVGEVFERDTARAVYQRVTTRRRDPGLLEEDGEGAFSFKVFPVEPNEQKKVEVRWTKWLERRGQTVHYSAPLTSRNAEVVINLVGPAKNLRSTTHHLHAEKIPGGTRLRADAGTFAGEIDLFWDVDEPAWTPDVFVHTDGQNEGYFAVSLATPATAATSTQAKDVTIVIDKSGSMEGDPMDHADAAAAEMIKLLSNEDRVNVIAFSDEVDPLFRTPQPVSEVRGRAINFAKSLTASGGTDIALALTTAIKSQDRRDGRPRIIVFMTDGQSDADKAMAAAKTDTGDVRMFTLGLGKEVNRPLLERLSAEKRGTFTYIPDARAIEPEVRRVATHIARPVLVDLSLEVDGVQASRMYPRTLPDLFADDELLISGRLKGTGTAKFTIKGKIGGKEYTFTRSAKVTSEAPRRWVGGLWAQARIEHLLEELALNGDQPELKNEAIELALAYNIVTPFTAFLAIPESELGEMAGTVAAARDKKAKILASHQDAASLGGVSVDKNAPPPPPAQHAPMIDATSTTQNIPVGRTFEESISVQGAPPMASPDSPRDHAMKKMSRADDDGDDDARGGGEPIAATGEVSRKQGCGGCASGGSGGSTFVMALLVGVVIRRGRSSKRRAPRAA